MFSKALLSLVRQNATLCGNGLINKSISIQLSCNIFDCNFLWYVHTLRTVKYESGGQKGHAKNSSKLVADIWFE